MTTATLEKRVRALEAEVEELKQVVQKRPHLFRVPVSLAPKTKKLAKKGKKLPRWLQASLKEVEEGKVRGPFNTVEELMADLRRPGK